MTISFEKRQPSWRDFPEDETCILRCVVETDECDDTGMLSVSTGDHARGDTFYTFGFWNPDSADGDWKNPAGWHAAGWCMTHDNWTDATGFYVTGWSKISDNI